MARKKKDTRPPTDDPDEIGRRYVTDKLDPKGEIAARIMSGWKLSPEQFAVAKAARYFSPPDIPYKDFLLTYYEEPEPNGRVGYICLRVASKKTGEHSESFCIWGTHVYELRRDALRPEQVEWITSAGWAEEQIGSGDHYQIPRFGEKDK